MEELKPAFIKGAVEIGGATEAIAEEFWNQLLEFANYCFNKSHAVVMRSSLIDCISKGTLPRCLHGGLNDF